MHVGIQVYKLPIRPFSVLRDCRQQLIQVWHEGRCLGGDAYMQPQLLHNLVNLLLHCCGVPGSLFALYGLHTQKLISNLTLGSISIRDDPMTSAATEHIQRIQHTEY